MLCRYHFVTVLSPSCIFYVYPILLTHRLSISYYIKLRSLSLRGLRRRFEAAWLLGSRVQIQLNAWMFVSCVYVLCCPVTRSRWPRGLRRRSWPLGYWDRGLESRSCHGCISLCLYVVLFCVVRGLCEGQITRPEESYRVSGCVLSNNPETGGQRSILDYKRL
jgi:hypothetical protein